MEQKLSAFDVFWVGELNCDLAWTRVETNAGILEVAIVEGEKGCRIDLLENVEDGGNLELHFDVIWKHFLPHAEEFHGEGILVGTGRSLIFDFALEAILNLALVSAAIKFVS